MKIVLASAVLATVIFTVDAQEYGRGALSSEKGLGRAALPEAKYDGYSLGGTWGAKLSLGWANVDWDLGPASGSESIFAPQVSLFYKATDALDVNFSAVALSAEDDDNDLGVTEAEMTRLALGLRYWIDTGTRITPYIGGGLGVCLMDGDTDNTLEDGVVVPAEVSVEDAPGLYLEGGVAFLVSDGFFVHADLTYDTLLGSADAEINGESEDFDVESLSVNLGVTFMF